MFPVERHAGRDVQLLVVVLSPEVGWDMIKAELESCNQKTSVLSQTWQWARAPESLSLHSQLRLACQIKDISFLHTPWLTWFTNTAPVSRTFPSEHDDKWKHHYTQAGLQIVGRNGHFSSYWPFEVLQGSSLRLAHSFFWFSPYLNTQEECLFP